MKKYKRWQYKIIKNALKTRRILLLCGPRQCGKTTLAKELSSNQTIYRTLDDVTLRNSARDDPHGFVKHENELMIIDEIQRAPDLLQAVKMDVDINQENGRFLLTGSSNINALPNIQESLAGRVRTVRLRPFSMGERCDQDPSFLQKAFMGDMHYFNLAPEVDSTGWDKKTYIQNALLGGYPEALHFNDTQDVRQWHKDYITALIERDLKEVINIRRKDNILKLLEVLASWSSKFLEISKVSSTLSIQRASIETYINALETLYLIERVKPWIKTDYDRVGKHDKIFMTDTGLMSSILRWNIEKVYLDGDMNGKLLETYVLNQLMPIIEAQSEDFHLYHYRDREKREIDFLIENDKGDLLAIEVKAGSAVGADSFKHMKWFENNLAKDRRFIGILLYTGEHTSSFGKNLFAVPINRLWLS